MLFDRTYKVLCYAFSFSLAQGGHGKREEEEKDEHLYCCERYSGSFQTVFQLPTGIKGDKVEATFDKGVLKITLPKIEEAKKKEIEIKVN